MGYRLNSYNGGSDPSDSGLVINDQGEWVGEPIGSGAPGDDCDCFIKSFVASGSVLKGDTLALNPSNGTVGVIGVGGATSSEFVGIALEAVGAGSSVRVALPGAIADLSGLSVNQFYWLNSSGVLVTSDTGLQRVGRSLSSDKLLLEDYD